MMYYVYEIIEFMYLQHYAINIYLEILNGIIKVEDRTYPLVLHNKW